MASSLPPLIFTTYTIAAADAAAFDFAAARLFLRRRFRRRRRLSAYAEYAFRRYHSSPVAADSGCFSP